MAVYLGQNEVILRNGISTTDADATAADILVGKTAYVDDKKIIGTMPATDPGGGTPTNPGGGTPTNPGGGTPTNPGGGTPTDSGVGTLFTGATIPLTFKNNTNIYENEYEYKSEHYNITITGLDSVATITGNGSKNVKVTFAVSSSTNSITMFNINITNGTESYNFVGRFFYYGTEVADGNCLAVTSKILPESGTGDFSNFDIIESSTYPLFSTNTVSWKGVFSHQIIGFIFAKKSIPIGNYFLAYCYAFNQPLTLPSGLTSIGSDFLESCGTFNQPLTLPSGLTTIGTYFLAYCPFNQLLTLPSGLTTIGDYFLTGCSSFNQPLTLPSGLTTTGNYFLNTCSAFNQPLTLPSGLTTIGTYFLQSCYSFNQPLTLPSGPTSIGGNFLSYCSAFNQLLTLPSGLTSIGGNFLYSCGVFNQPLTLPSGLTAIGNGFLQNCSAFNQPLTLPSGLTTIGNNFLYYCYAFNQPLTIPSGLTSIGTYFLHRCLAFTFLIYNASVYPTDNTSMSQTTNTKTSTNGTGIKVIGTNAAGLKAALPNRTDSPFRKLV